MIHLDTNTVVAYLRGNAAIAQRLRASLPDVRISTLVYGELRFGAQVSARAEANVTKVLGLLNVVPAVPFDEACAQCYADIKTELRRTGKPTGEMDALIAAVAIAHSATLVTHNQKDFENIPGVQLDDWLT